MLLWVFVKVKAQGVRGLSRVMVSEVAAAAADDGLLAGPAEATNSCST